MAPLWAAVVLIAVAAAAMTACSSGGGPDDVPLARAAVAVYLSSDAELAAQGGGGGVVVMVGPDGRDLSSVSTEGIDGPRIVADRSRLYFSDKNNEYTFDGKLTTVKRPSTDNSQTDLQVKSDGGRLSVLNHGVEGDQYVMNLASGPITALQSASIHDYIHFVVMCSDQFYAVSSPDVSDERTTELKVLGTPDAAGQVIGHIQGDTAPLMAAVSSTCVGDEAVFLSQAGESAAATPSLVRWNVRTGKVVTVPLAMQSGPPLTSLEPAGSIESGAMGTSGAMNGALYWSTGGGEVYRTILASGNTTKAWTINLHRRDSGTQVIKFGYDSVFVLDSPDFQTLPTLSEYDLTTGQLKAKIDLPDILKLAADKSWSPGDFALVGGREHLG